MDGGDQARTVRGDPFESCCRLQEVEGYACSSPLPYYCSLLCVTHLIVALSPQPTSVRWMPCLSSSLVCSGNIKRVAGSGFRDSTTILLPSLGIDPA